MGRSQKLQMEVKVTFDGTGYAIPVKRSNLHKLPKEEKELLMTWTQQGIEFLKNSDIHEDVGGPRVGSIVTEECRKSMDSMKVCLWDDLIANGRVVKAAQLRSDDPLVKVFEDGYAEAGVVGEIPSGEWVHRTEEIEPEFVRIIYAKGRLQGWVSQNHIFES